MTKKAKFLRLVEVEGLGVREAARRAGYVHGVPSDDARAMLRQVHKVRRNLDASGRRPSEASAWLARRIQEYEASLAACRAQLAAAQHLEVAE